MIPPTISEVAEKLKTVNRVTFRYKGEVYEYTRIPASEARHYGGEPLNLPLSDPRRPIQLKTTRKAGQPPVTYHNFWES